MSDFTAAENERFMDGLKRRAYMLTFPNEPVPAADQIEIDVEYSPYEAAVGYHESEQEVLRLFVGKKTESGSLGVVSQESEELAQFLREFFGVENA